MPKTNREKKGFVATMFTSSADMLADSLVPHEEAEVAKSREVIEAAKRTRQKDPKNFDKMLTGCPV